MGVCISSNFCRVRRNLNSNNTQQQLQNRSFENSLNRTIQGEQICATQNNNPITTETIQTESTNTINFNSKRNDQIDSLVQSEPLPSNLSVNSNYLLNNINSYNSYTYFVPPTGRNKRLKKNKYKYFKCEKKISEAQLKAKRDEFWDTAPHFDGKVEIWSALKAAVDACEIKNFTLAQAIIDSANIILPNGLLNDCYDELGNRYQLPIYVLARPVNLAEKSNKLKFFNESDSSCSSSKNKTNEGEEDEDCYADDDVSNKNISNDEEINNENNSSRAKALQKKFRIFKKVTKQSNKKSSAKMQKNSKNNQEALAHNSAPKNESKIIAIKLRISSLSNQEDDIKLEVDLNQSVLALKSQINELKKIEPINQRIFFRGKLMRDHQKLKYHKVYKNVVLQCIVRETQKQSIIITSE
jgi:hypothetical protein